MYYVNWKLLLCGTGDDNDSYPRNQDMDHPI